MRQNVHSLAIAPSFRWTPSSGLREGLLRARGLVACFAFRPRTTPSPVLSHFEKLYYVVPSQARFWLKVSMRCASLQMDGCTSLEAAYGQRVSVSFDHTEADINIADFKL